MKSFVGKTTGVVSIALLAVLVFPGVTRGAVINVDMDHYTTYSGTAAAPDAGVTWNSFTATNTLAAGSVKDSQNNILPGVAIALASNNGSHIYNDAGTGNPNPLNLMSDYTYGATYAIVITGLAAGQPYDLYAYSHGNADNQTGTITLDAANGGASASTSPTGDAANFRNIFQWGQGYTWVKLNGTADGSGTFKFTVVNYLNGFQLQRSTPPVIANLTNQTVIAGNDAVLSPAITGVPYPALQWSSNNIPIAGATNAALVLSNVQYAQNGTVYSLVAGNAAGTVTNRMTLTVDVAPAIANLNNQAVPTGVTVTIAPIVSGAPAPALQWLRDGVALNDGSTGNGSTVAGSATDTLVITDAQDADSGLYSLVAGNRAGTVTNGMTLTVSSGNVAPAITGPVDQTVVQASNATFSASVSGLPVPVLQWRVNGVNIAGATETSLTVTNAQYTQNGDIYSLVASNVAGMKTNSATLYVLVPPFISQQPTNRAVVTGSPATFSVAAGGVPNVSYQWNRNGVSIANATNASYTLAGATGADNGAVFSVTVSNRAGVVTSDVAGLTVLSTMTGVLLPANGAVNIAPDQQLRIVFSGGTPKLGAGRLFVRDAADDSLLATIDTSRFQTFSLFAATITNAFVRAVQGASYYYQPIAIYGNEAWITLNPTNRFAYGKTYYVNCDAGLFLDASNAAFPAITGSNTWRFSTRPSGPATPTASTGPTNITVGLDGAGDFATLQGVADWIPQNNTLKRTITIAPGIYRDNATFAQNRNNVVIIGAGANREAVQIFYPYPAFSSSNGAGTLRVESSDVYVRNLTLDNAVYLTNNGVVFAGPIQTLQTTGQRIIFDHVLIKGGQDTVYNIGGMVYYNRCEVWGSVDFIYGAALAVFDQCNIVEIRNTGGPVTAPNTDYAAPYGLTFLNCTFPRALIANGYPYDVNPGSTTFMRPWRQDGMTAIINCAVDSQISTAGWSTFGNTNEVTCRAREYGTTLIGGGGAATIAQRQAAGAYWLNTIDPDYTSSAMSPLDPLLAPPTGTNNRVTVTINPDDYTLAAIFGNAYYNLNGWMPAVIPTITAQPTNQSAVAGATAAFSLTAVGLPAPAYQWLKNGTNLPAATNAVLTITNAQAGDAGTYSVVVSNSAGAVASSNVTLTIFGLSAPQITTQPTNQAAAQGGSVSFGVAASGNPAPAYHWLKNGAPIADATNATLTLANVQVTDIAVYSVIVSNSVDSVTSSNATFNLTGPNGYAMVDGSTTGGAGGTVVTVTNGTDFNTQINVVGLRIIQVQGVLSIGRIFTKDNKTIIGLGTNATLMGNLNISGVTNVIVQNVRVTGPANDGFTIWNAQHVWIDHCTFYDTGDGLCDMNNGSQYVTVSWCKFHYVSQLQHRFTMIADGYTNTATQAVTYGYYTLHHNWWSTRCDQRQASSSYGRLHYYNNYWNCTNDSYAALARADTEILSQNNYYAGVKSPLYTNGAAGGRIQSSGNIYAGCTGIIHPGTDTVAAPAYGYLLDAAAEVPAIVMAGAGAPGPDTLPIPPKIWTGGGSGNNWNTANNWGSNETPKTDDVLIFAGNTRLSPNNNLAASTEYYGIIFSNTAGAFSLGGNAFNLGGPITDDSAAIQTINANLDFTFGQFHYTTNRYINVSAADGSLVINGNLSGTNNPGTGYFNSYRLTKQGPGLLTLNGTNTFVGSLQLDGGLIQFKTLDTNQPGSLGDGSVINLNGGGLRWAAGNAADISSRTVALQAGGATLDAGANNITLASAIGGNGSGGLTKTGAGKITLNGNNNYSGATAIIQGTLALGAAGALPGTSSIILSNAATLDVSTRSDGTLTLGDGQSLTGNGNVLGSVTAASGSTIAPGTAIGALAVSGTLNFQSGSTNVMKLNAAARTNDLLTGMGSVNYGGTLLLTNLGGALAAGDIFKLFSAGAYNDSFGNIRWPALPSGLAWTNRLALDGSIAVVPVVNTTPTNLVAAVVGDALQLSWPDDHVGWHLEVQTNRLEAGLGTNWVPILESYSTNQITLPIDRANSVTFFRLKYP